MSGSYEKINYSLRPAKAIERKMMCDTFRRLSPFGRVETYRYIGFGSPFFNDFILFHKALDISNMISIEIDKMNKHRFEFNCPFNCIDIKFGHSNEILPTLSWEERSIVWLDYDGKLDSKVLSDVYTFCTKASLGSVIVISINVQPDRSEHIEIKELANYRIEKLKERVGEDKLPKDVDDKNLRMWGTAEVCQRILKNEILHRINERNSGRAFGNKIHYKQLFNFCYADGAKMMTTGGLLYEEGQQHIVAQCLFDNLSFIQENGEPYFIEIPNLTFKEIRCLDEQLPRIDDQELYLPSVPEEHLKLYEKVYRYFPTFAETNM